MNDTVKASIADLTDFTALDPFFRIIEQGLAGLVQPNGAGAKADSSHSGTSRTKVMRRECRVHAAGA
ncbi:MAG: hypothetical protein ACRDPF_34345 [Streptosporangiaceae bacterium]